MNKPYLALLFIASAIAGFTISSLVGLKATTVIILIVAVVVGIAFWAYENQTPEG